MTTGPTQVETGVSTYDDLEERWAELDERIYEAAGELREIFVERDELIAEAYDEGLSLRGIGEVIGMSHTAVRNRLLAVDPVYDLRAAARALGFDFDLDEEMSS